MRRGALPRWRLRLQRRRTRSGRRRAPRPARRRRRPGAAAPRLGRSTRSAGRGVQRVPAGRPERVVDARPAPADAGTTRSRAMRVSTTCSRSCRTASSTRVERLGRPRPASRPAAAGSAGRARRRRRPAGGCRSAHAAYRSWTSRRNDRGDGSSCSSGPQSRRRELLQQRPGVQRVALRPVPQPAGRGRADAGDAQLAARSRRSSSSSPRSRSTVPRCPLTSRRRLSGSSATAVVAHRHDGQHLVGDQAGAARRSAPAATAGRPSARRRRPGSTGAPSSRSSSSSNRVPTVTGSSTGPDGAAGATPIDRSPGRRSRPRRPRPGRPSAQLLDHPVGQQLLGLLAAGPDHDRWPASAPGSPQELLDQRGLADPGRPLDQHDLRRPASASASRARSTASSGCRPTNGTIVSLVLGRAANPAPG